MVFTKYIQGTYTQFIKNVLYRYVNILVQCKQNQFFEFNWRFFLNFGLKNIACCMKDKIIIIITVLFVFSSKTISQSNCNFIFLPGGLNFMPLKANNQEARLGLLYYTSTTNLKVDIGNTVDLLSFESSDSKTRITAGIEFMTYAFSKSYAGKRLQISAVDGFFGGNFSYSSQFEKSKLLARFRIIHNSAHLVDGSYDADKDVWIDGKEPIPFTKDFWELTVAHQLQSENYLLKYYGGLSYAALVRPDELKKYNFNFGFEFAVPNIFGTVFSNDANIFLADHFYLDGTAKYSGSNQLMVGMKFGSWNKKGIVIYASYYSGRDMFSSYYDRKISKFGIGFFIDFF